MAKNIFFCFGVQFFIKKAQTIFHPKAFFLVQSKMSKNHILTFLKVCIHYGVDITQIKRKWAK